MKPARPVNARPVNARQQRRAMREAAAQTLAKISRHQEPVPPEHRAAPWFWDDEQERRRAQAKQRSLFQT